MGEVDVYGTMILGAPHPLVPPANPNEVGARKFRGIVGRLL
jgi:hypothetical protein